jgi:glucose PTS system EIICB or EIICBA component
VNNVFNLLQQIGKSLMLPVAVLPVAGLLLGIGSSNFFFIPDIVSQVMAKSGDAVFTNLPLIFAVGVALGLANNDGVAAIAAVVGYYIMIATLAVIGMWLGLKPIQDDGAVTIDTGVLGGIIIGVVAAAMFNRFYRVKLPTYLGFFAGKRFVPIVAGVAAIFVGLFLSMIWPTVQGWINVFSHWAATQDPRLAATIYGFVERLLLPFGLHHIWNVPFFFQIGDFVNAQGQHIHGDIARFFAGDPTAGILSGAFLFKMWGLPAAAIAMWHCARPDQRKRVGGLMISAALTSFLTGVTEPIEFTFLFLAPPLFLIHALLAGAAQFISNMLHIPPGLHLLPGRHRLPAVQRVRQKRAELVDDADPRTALCVDLLCDLSGLYHLLRRQDARSRDRGCERRANRPLRRSAETTASLGRGGWWPPLAVKPISPTSTPASPA